jgi:hypothetical protein
MGDTAPKVIKVQADRKYSLADIYDVLLEEASLPAQPYISKQLGISTIYIPGLGGDDVAIGVKKETIVVGFAPRSADAPEAAAAPGELRERWAELLGGDTEDIQEAQKFIASEVRRLFGEMQ